MPAGVGRVGKVARILFLLVRHPRFDTQYLPIKCPCQLNALAECWYLVGSMQMMVKASASKGA